MFDSILNNLKDMIKGPDDERSKFTKKVDKCFDRILSTIENEKLRVGSCAIVQIVLFLLCGSNDEKFIGFMRAKLNETCDDALKMVEKRKSKG
jgi:hypothetical protein